MSSQNKNHTKESSSLSEKNKYFLEPPHSKKSEKKAKNIGFAKSNDIAKSAKNAHFVDFAEFVEIGKIGHLSGLKGRLCFWLSGDFEEFLSRGIEVRVRLANELESLKSKKKSKKESNIESKKITKDFASVSSNTTESNDFTPALSTHTSHTLIVSSFIKKNDKYFIEFEGITSADSAKRLVNAKIYATKEQSRKHCKLKKDEYFYFDIIGLDIVENGENIGIVRDIERIGNIDYFIVEVADNLISNNTTKSTQPKIPTSKNIAKSTNLSSKSTKPLKSTKKQNNKKTFLVPYIDKFVLEVCLQTRRIFTNNAKAILEQS